VASPQDTPQILERFHSHLDLVDVIARQIARELGRSVELSPGDRLDLPPDLLHSALVGPDGVVCLEAHRTRG